MKHNYWLLFFLFPLVGNAQTDDIEGRLGYLPQWQFHNELEMQTWPKLLAGEQIDHETLFLMSIPGVSTSRLAIYRERIEALYQDLAKKGFAKKSRMNQVKMLQKILFKDYSRQYEYLSGLDKLLDQGTFNCLSAATLSALVMEHFQIPYQLKEQDNIIVLEVGEGAEKILMSTKEGLGYTPDNSLMEGLFVGFLEKFNIISSQERKLYSDRQLFHKYLYGRGKISLRELAGIHYMNQAYLAFIEEDRVKALSLIEKAFVFFPSGERVAYWIINERLGMYKIENWGRPDIMQDFRATINALSLYSKNPSLNMSFFGLGYESILDKVLFYQYLPQKAEDYHRYLLEDLPNEALRTQADLIFTTKIAIAHHNNQAYEAAFPYIIAANKKDPDFREHKLLLLENARAHLMNDAANRLPNYEAYVAATPHDSLKQELRALYLNVELYDLLARGNEADYETSFPIVEELYLLKPKIADNRYNYRQMLRYMLTTADRADWCISHLLQVQDSLTPLGKAELIAPFLPEAIMINVRLKFMTNQFTAGLAQLDLFKENVGKRFDVPRADLDPFVGDAYWEYAAYYIRKVNYKKARSVLEEARPYLSDDGFIDEKINKVLIPLGG